MTDFKYPKIDKSLPTISITDVLGMVSEPFDRDKVVENTYNKHHDNPKSQYYQKTKEEIVAMWEEKGATSTRYGRLLDDYIGLNLVDFNENKLELWKLDNNYDYDNRLKTHCTAFDDFISLLKESGDTEFICREKTVYYKVGDYYIKGRFDALFKNKRTGKYIVIDWKSSGSIDKNKTPWTKNLLGPCSNLPALNWFTYTLQLFFYKKALVESGYLPEGTSLDDVTVMIVNLPDHIIEETGKTFGTHQAAFNYDNELMNRLFDFAIRKHKLLNS